MQESIKQYVESNLDRFISELTGFLRIPSVSADPAHYPNMVEACQWVENQLTGLGFKTQIFDQGMLPTLYAEWMQAGPDAPTVLFYGHYDVQPPDPLDLWNKPPFEPHIEDGKIFARGANDDKGQMSTHLKAFEAFMRSAGKLPVNAKVLIEGEEEIGSPHLLAFVEEHKELLKCDCAVISDTTMWGKGVPSLCYSLRGMQGIQVDVTGPNRDLHSGVYGGAVANPANVICHLMAALHDDKGRVTIPGFYDGVQPLQEWERESFASLPFDEKAFQEDLGVDALTGEEGYTTLERRWARPTLDINGISSGYQGPGAKTIIPSRAFAKVTMRLVPGQDPDRIYENFKDYMNSECPPGVQLQFLRENGSPAVSLPTEGPVMEAAKSAMEACFGAKPFLIREGASVPVVGSFATALEVPCALLGFGLPDDNLHSPNEKFDLDNFHRGILAVCHFMDELAGKFKG